MKKVILVFFVSFCVFTCSNMAYAYEKVVVKPSQELIKVTNQKAKDLASQSEKRDSANVSVRNDSKKDSVPESKKGVKAPEIFPEPDKMKIVDDYYLPLQEKPQYYSDRKCKSKINMARAADLIKYKPNFGKKVWMKSHDAKSIKKMRKYLGKLVSKKNFMLTALEIGDHVYPHVKEFLKDSNIDIDAWSDKFEIWGRTYVDPSRGGKKRSKFIAIDFQNGNFLIVSPRRGKKKCYYISEKYDSIIKSILSYTPLNER